MLCASAAAAGGGVIAGALTAATDDQICRETCSAPINSRLVSVEACQGSQVAVCQGVKVLCPDILLLVLNSSRLPLE